MDLWWLANDESCLRHQAFWHSWQGRLKGNKVTTSLLIDVLEGVHGYPKGILMTLKYRALSPKNSTAKALALLRERWRALRYSMLNGRQEGRRGFERNRRDDY